MGGIEMEKETQEERSLKRAKLFNKIALENYKKMERKEDEEFIKHQKEAFEILKKASSKNKK